jgi:CBS domain-containing protein
VTPGTAGARRGPMKPVVVHRHVVVLADGSVRSLRFVCCPDGEVTIPLGDCASCGRSRGLTVDERLEREVVDCALAPADLTDVEPQRASPARDPLLGAEVAGAMSRDVVCATAETPEAVLKAMMGEHSIGVLVLVDAEHRPVGLVSSDLTRLAVVPVNPRTPLTRAAALMAYEGLHHLVVVEDGGRLAGVLSAIDVLRHLGEAGGALIPPRTLRQRESE